MVQSPLLYRNGEANCLRGSTVLSLPNCLEEIQLKLPLFSVETRALKADKFK